MIICRTLQRQQHVLCISHYTKPTLHFVTYYRLQYPFCSFRRECHIRLAAVRLLNYAVIALFGCFVLLVAEYNIHIIETECTVLIGECRIHVSCSTNCSDVVNLRANKRTRASFRSFVRQHRKTRSMALHECLRQKYMYSLIKICAHLCMLIYA